MPTLVVCTGFEFGTTAGWTTGNAGNLIFDAITDGTWTISTTDPHTGTYCLNGVASAGGARWVWTVDTVVASQHVVHRAWVRVNSGSGTFMLMACDTSTGQQAGIRWNSSTSKFEGGVEGGTFQTTSGTYSTATWHLLEYYINRSANPWVLKWRVNDVAQTDATFASAATNSDFVYFGDVNSGTWNADFDDTAVSRTAADYPLGRGKAVLLKVDPAGTVTASDGGTDFRRFTSNGTIDGAWNAANVRDAVTEVPPTIGATASGACQITTDTTNHMVFPMTTYTLQAGESVNGGRLVACGWAASTTAATIGFRSYNGTTERTLFAAADPNFDNSTTAPAWLCRMLTPADIDTQAELDALDLRIGFSGDAAPDVGVHAVYVELDVLTPDATDATASPAAISVAVATPSATVSAGSTATPSATVSAAALPAATVAASSTVQPATTAAVAASPSVTVSAGSTVSPAVTATTVSVPVATAVGEAPTAPATTATTVSVPAPALSAGSTPTPATVAAVVGQPAVTPSAGSTPTPAATAVVVASPAVNAGGSVDTAPDTVTAPAALPAAAASAGSTPAPAVLAAVTALPAAAITAGSTPTPTTVVGTVSLPAVDATAAVVTAPDTVTAQVSLPAAGASGGATPTPNTAAAVVTMPAAAPTAGSTPQPATVTATVAAPAVTPSAGATPTLDVVAAVVGVPAAALAAGSTVTPAAITALAGFPAVSVSAGAAVTPATITAVATLPAVSISTVDPVNLVLVIGAVARKWTTAPPELKWAAGDPQAKWRAEEPSVKWRAAAPQAKWRTGPVTV